MTSDTKSLKLRVSRSAFASLALYWPFLWHISTSLAFSIAATGVTNDCFLMDVTGSLLVISTRDLLMLLTEPKLSTYDLLKSSPFVSSRLSITGTKFCLSIGCFSLRNWTGFRVCL